MGFHWGMSAENFRIKGCFDFSYNWPDTRNDMWFPCYLDISLYSYQWFVGSNFAKSIVQPIVQYRSPLSFSDQYFQIQITWYFSSHQNHLNTFGWIIQGTLFVFYSLLYCIFTSGHMLGVMIKENLVDIYLIVCRNLQGILQLYH